jgi:class 3 adenylate cyclase
VSQLCCINNRSIIIIAAYVSSRQGTIHPLFEGLPFPKERFRSPVEFFLNEDEWTTYENYENIFRRAKELVAEPDFFFKCGASAARLRSWGRFHHFVTVFTTPSDGFIRLPFFNKNFNDTKEIEVVIPPTYDRGLKKLKVILKVTFHNDFDPNRDYVGDPYLRGIISCIPTLWGLPPAIIRQPINAYDPLVLFTREPEFAPYALAPRMEGDFLTLMDPLNGERCVAGKRVVLEPEEINGRSVYLGKYRDKPLNARQEDKTTNTAILATRTVRTANRVLISEGEIYNAPCFILEIIYEPLSFTQRMKQVFRSPLQRESPGDELIETIERLRESIRSKNEAYAALEKTNEELSQARVMLDDYARGLEKKVEERTQSLKAAREELLKLNQELEARVKQQVDQLQRYSELRRYLSPKLTEQILAGNHLFASELRRKEMTVVFTDIRGFSALTDSLEPEEVFQLLNRYISEMISIIHDYDGTLNKIAGDGLLIFFGDPIPMEDHAERAVRMAVAMQKKVEELGGEWKKLGHELGVGIGVNTGYMTVGTIGNESLRDYTVIGTQANVAARLVSLAAAGQILVSHRTYSRVRDLFESQEIGEISVKGVHSPVKTYVILP